MMQQLYMNRLDLVCTDDNFPMKHNVIINCNSKLIYYSQLISFLKRTVLMSD